MEISLIDVDGHHFPNLALMKIAAYHKQQKDKVSWYMPLYDNPDKIYASKVFTFSALPEINYNHKDLLVTGGTGYKKYEDLDEEIDTMEPDYSIYPQYDFAIGFLSRGCIRNCKWCVVPKKEGNLRQYSDIEKIHSGRRKVVLMDNNFLANDIEFIKEQLQKSKRLKLKIDFNQGLDARLITEEIAKLLAEANWINYIRLACDQEYMLPYIKNAYELLNENGYSKEIFCYVLAEEEQESLNRIQKLTEISHKITPFCQPFRDINGGGQITNKRLKDLARWCNRPWLRKSCTYQEYLSSKFH